MKAAKSLLALALFAGLVALAMARSTGLRGLQQEERAGETVVVVPANQPRAEEQPAPAEDRPAEERGAPLNETGPVGPGEHRANETVVVVPANQPRAEEQPAPTEERRTEERPTEERAPPVNETAQARPDEHRANETVVIVPANQTRAGGEPGMAGQNQSAALNATEGGKHYGRGG